MKFCRQYIVFHDERSVVYSGASGNCTEIKGEYVLRKDIFIPVLFIGSLQSVCLMGSCYCFRWSRVRCVKAGIVLVSVLTGGSEHVFSIQ